LNEIKDQLHGVPIYVTNFGHQQSNTAVAQVPAMEAVYVYLEDSRVGRV